MDNLLRLRIPAGWAVTYNHFADVDPIVAEDGGIDNWDCFKESLLQISHLQLKKGRHQIPERTILIDLGWYPEASMDGAFRLCIVIVDPNAAEVWEYVEEYSSKDRFAIRGKLEAWMHAIHFRYREGMSKEEVSKILKI